ncbi:MAG: serine hydrolase [Acidobacteriota bacterium]
MSSAARAAVLLGVVWALVCPCSAQSYDFHELDRTVDEFARTQPSGVALVLIKDGRILYERRTAGRAAHDSIHVASAIKVVTATVLSMLHEEGVLSIDAPLGDSLPAFRETTPQLRISHLLSHTSGLPQEDDCLYHGEATTDVCVAQIAARGSRFRPGQFFEYGNSPMQVAAHAAEAVTGKSWDQIFEEMLGRPLSLNCTTVIHRDLPVSTPAAANGAFSCVDDFIRILTMLSQHGAIEGRRVTSSRSIARLFSPRTIGANMIFSPLLSYVELNPLLNLPNYGLGAFIDRISSDARPVDIVSPGSEGFIPWLDSERNLAGLLSTQDSLKSAYPVYVEIKKLIARIVPPNPLSSSGILNAASYENGSLAPGMFVSLYGNDLADTTITLAPEQAVTSLAGTSLLVNGEPALLFYASPGQLNAIMPLSLRGRQTATISLERNGFRQPSFEHPVQPVSPGLFPFIYDANWEPVTIFKPAHAGDTIVLFLNGSGVAGDPKSPAAVVPTNSASNTNTRVLLAGKEATVLYEGAAQGMFPGTAQINIKLGQVPRGMQAAPLSVVIDGVATQAGFGIPVE